MDLVLQDECREVMSRHPYLANTTSDSLPPPDEGEVVVPRATQLELRFDSRCASLEGHVLEIAVGPGCQESLFGRFGGGVLQVTGDTFRYRFPVKQRLGWTLDPKMKGPGFALREGNRTAEFTQDKKWQSVFGTQPMASGVHTWVVRVEHTTAAGNIFFGVALRAAKTSTYLGADKHGWGWIGVKACWHGGSKTNRQFGTRLKIHDTVRISLDLDALTLSLAKNGVPMGIAFSNLPRPVPGRKATHYYPAFSMYNKADKFTLISASSPRCTDPDRGGDDAWAMQRGSGGRLSAAGRRATTAGVSRPSTPLASAARGLPRRGVSVGSADVVGAIDADTAADGGLPVTEQFDPLAGVPPLRAELATQLESMGYRLDICVRALSRTGDSLARAVEYVLEHRDGLEAESRAAALDRARAARARRATAEQRWLLRAGSRLSTASSNVSQGLTPRARAGPSNSMSSSRSGGPSPPPRPLHSRSSSTTSVADGGGGGGGTSGAPPPPLPSPPLYCDSGAVGDGDVPAGPDWGFRFTVVPTFPAIVAFELAHRTAANRERMEQIHAVNRRFSLEMDCALVNYVGRMCAKANRDVLVLSPEDVRPTPEELLHFKSLEGVPIYDLQLRFLILRNFNRRLQSVLPLVDLSRPDHESALAAMVRKLRGLIFGTVKRRLWSTVLEESSCGDGHKIQKDKDPQATVDRNRAQAHAKTRQPDMKGTRTVFGQLMQQLHWAAPRTLRNSQRAWYTILAGEQADDYGGPYREVFGQASNDLMSPALPLFVRCPNHFDNLGENRDVWLPNPKATTPTLLTMYGFLGKLMGIAIRTKNPMALNLASLVWKPLVQQPLFFDEDVRAADLNTPVTTDLFNAPLRPSISSVLLLLFCVPGTHCRWLCISVLSAPGGKKCRRSSIWPRTTAMAEIVRRGRPWLRIWSSASSRMVQTARKWSWCPAGATCPSLGPRGTSICAW